jgi:hypothetical protein
VQFIRRSAESLTELVNDLLELAKMTMFRSSNLYQKITFVRA